MSQVLALEWNQGEARVAVASTRGSQVVIEQAFAIPLRGQSGGDEGSASDVGGRIAAALAQRGLGRLDALVAIGRGSIELRQLQLPAAPSDELPDLVRFQAMREFNELDESWLLDFMPVDESADGSRTVLATAIGPDLAAQMEGVCAQAGLKMRRLVLRSCAAASLVARAKIGHPAQAQLLVDLLTDEADLTVMLGGRVIFLRTTRLAGDPPSLSALLTEIRLTMAAVQNQLGGQKVHSIILCGRGEAHATLARQIQDELKTPAQLFDPFTGLELASQLRRALPEQTGRFAPVLGMLLAELEQTGHAVDFLHPRRCVAPPNPRRKWLLAGIAAVLLPLAWFLYTRVERGRLATQVSALEAESKALDNAVTAAKKVRIAAAEIGKWADNDVNWLEQLRSLSDDLPSSDSAVVGQMTFSSGTNGNQIHLKGWVRGPETIAAMEDGLRAHGRQVFGKGSREDRALRHYSWRFETSLAIPRETKP
jgi:Tfp pilus assembly PilM family ATPase